ncbi:MAG TPA: NAD(P)H-dependent glycerol-3-phosphate dehydrogenase [Alphaproteobacteria bacterium]|nr:NAD(P)H-dependent glycerol-3-phosphate dehydrogenase [Alphaproteobacteria bacterium]
MPDAPYQRIAVIGAGAWGTALALVARRAGRDVVIAAREAEVVEAINTTRRNGLFLPGVVLDDGIRATADAAAAAAQADVVLLAAPAQHLRAVSATLAPHIAEKRPVIICAKGIERGTGMLMSEVASETLPRAALAILSGPTFAAEVARGLPTAVTLATRESTGGRLLASIGSTTFRPYLSNDPIGAQVGGAVKNVIAIACGIVTGRGMGDNARAALMTRGLAEIMRLGTALGARPETLMGLSGLGDLSLTCNGLQSRNMSVGIALGQGQTLAQTLSGKRSIAEGVESAAAIAELARRRGVDMPIVAAVDAILHHGAAIDDTIAGLLARPFKPEH